MPEANFNITYTFIKKVWNVQSELFRSTNLHLRFLTAITHSVKTQQLLKIVKNQFPMEKINGIVTSGTQLLHYIILAICLSDCPFYLLACIFQIQLEAAFIQNDLQMRKN